MMNTDAKTLRVLFVDDDEQVREFLGTFCAVLGMEYKITCSAVDAIGMLEKEHYQLVVTDLQMPEMDGLELAQYIKDNFPQIGLFAFTGESGFYPLAKLNDLFDKIYLKPCDYSRMLGEAMKFMALKKYPFLA